ncbi:DUF862-domain-containing protein [Cystobasidium minutum MCA 4210]|uniref:DUF862-domain-containing protein n=1 Tax=Cystobasidium minutum MCA 4210 TaxID=1397322 RepID=UPI0034CEDBFC|eukprot:jgi/Rhomi1/169953/fgenesh1_kg.3_\
MAPEKVELHLYDLSNGLAAQLSLQLTGTYIPAIWHSSIVVYGEEIYFGQGIQRCKPGQSHHGMALRVVPMGETHIDRDTFEDYLLSLRDVYTASKYHLTGFNCNTFTNDVVGFLTGGQIPQDVIDLPKTFLSTPFGQMLKPQIDAMFNRGSEVGPSAASRPAGPNGAACMLMNHVARTVQQPTPSTSHAQSQSNGVTVNGDKSLASSLSIATNMASFNSMLSSNKCVSVMFTADWCGPCRVVKPVFENLSRRSAEEPPVAFVLIDTTAGREIASHFNVSAVPTFKFFLDGKQQHEIKGADAGELKTQVQLLAMSGYPPHSHTKLKLPTLRALSTTPITYEQKPNFEAAIAKLTTFGTEEKMKLALDKAKPHLQRLSDPSRLTTEQITSVFYNVHALLEVLEPSQCFPLFDLLKYAVLQPTVAELAAESLSTDENVVLSILAKGSTSNNLNRPTQLTLLRLLCNCFSNQILASRLLSDSKARHKVTSILVQALLEIDNNVRVVAGSLAYDIACWRRKQRKTWTDEAAIRTDAYHEEEEFEIELCCAMLCWRLWSGRNRQMLHIDSWHQSVSYCYIRHISRQALHHS